jgi:outer membrane protein assembly factor BamB
MSTNAELNKVNNNQFQQQLVQQILLETGVIKVEHIQKALDVQKKLIRESKEKLGLLAYLVDQENYSLNIINPISNQLITQVPFPIRKKNAPEFNSTDWFPVANNSAVIFSVDDCQDIDEITWGSNEKIGLTVSNYFNYLQSQSTEKSFYFPVMNKLFYDSSPSDTINSLPIDMTFTLNKKNIYFTDRGAGILYIFDTEMNKLSGAAHLRPAGHRRALNVTSTNDGRKIFVTDNETPALFIIESKTLKIKKQPLSYGNLGNIVSDEQWIYMIIDKPNSTPELLVLDIHNLIVRATIQLTGELFSKIDDPYDLLTVSPNGKFLLVMTYVNYPSMFTPVVNIIDLQSFQLVDQVFLNDRGKPTYISFGLEKPNEFKKAGMGVIDILIELGYITEEHVINAIEKAEEKSSPKTQENIQLRMQPEDDEEVGLSLIDEEENPEQEADSLTSAQKYPVLNQFDLDPSLLLAFKEEQMRYFSFLPINKIDGKLTLAVANPAHKGTLKQIIEQKFPDLEVVTIDFTLNEFNRFMKEFYSVIKEKYDSIISKQIETQQSQTQAQQDLKNTPPVNKPETNQLKQAKKPPIPITSANRPKTDLPPNLSANIPSDVRVAVREKLKTLDPLMLEEAIMAICLEDFTSIWGIEVPRENLEKHRKLMSKAREEILDKDYAFINIQDLVGQFSLEIVINQEKLVVMLKTLSEIAQKKQDSPQSQAKVVSKSSADSKGNAPMHSEGKCEKCGVVIPPELDICSKCSRENEHSTSNDDVRAPSSPNPLANLEQGHLLITDQKGNRIIELNSNGQIIWQIGGKERAEMNPYSAVRLRSGTTLITDSEADRVIEYSKTGRIYWELTHREGFRDMYLRRPVHAIRLLNGNTLIVDQGNHRVFEINHLDKIVWQYGITANVGCTDYRLYNPSYAQRLSNGNTLITDTDNNRVIEIDIHDEVIWQYGNIKNKLGSGQGSAKDQLNSPSFAIKLDNNNVLIIDAGNKRIIEVNHEKQVVWFFATSIAQGSPIDINAVKAYRLNNGNTVIISPEQIIEINPEGQMTYIRQIEYLPKSPNFVENPISEEEDKIINDRMIRKTGDKAKQAVSNYVRNTSNLSEIEIPLIDRTNHKIMVINRYKNAIWKFGESDEGSDHYLERPQYMELIKDEYVLVADTDNHRVMKIYRPTKEIVWQYGISGAMGSGNNQLGHPRAATLTPDNTILISDQYSSRVMEINMEKEIVWICGGWEGGNNFINAPYYAERLKNNNTLITDWSNHIVIEIDKQGNIIWQYGTIKTAGNGYNQLMYPEKAIRTEDGNTIIVDTRNNRILEVNDANRVVWEFMNYRVGNTSKQLSNPTNVFRLENGHTVIIHNSNKNIIEINKNSEVVWQYQFSSEKKF